MSFNSWLQNLRSTLATRRGQRNHKRRGSLRAAMLGPKLDVLEDRCLFSFSPAVPYPAGMNPQDVVTADFNNDGHLDLATADSGDNAISVLLGDGQGGFGAASHFAAGSGPRSLVASDFNNDGKIDLAAANPDPWGSGRMSVLLGNGDGTFQSPLAVPLHSPTSPVSVGVADFNADQKMDLVVVSDIEIFSGTGGWIEVLLGDGAGAFPTSQLTEGSPPSPSLLAIDDLNADGTPDVVVAGGGYVEVWQGDGNGTLWMSYWTTGSGGQGSVGDFTGDGILDLVIAGQTVDVLPGLGDGTFASPIPNSANGSAHTAVATGDFNGDGKLDVVTSDGDAGSVSALLGNGDGTLSYVGAFATGSSPAAVVVGDFDADGRLDVAAANADSNTVSVLLNDGIWNVNPLPSLRIGDVTVIEGNTGAVNATFTVTLSGASTDPVTVAYASGDGTAASGSDYQPATGTLTFAPGETSKTISVQVQGDALVEPDEAFVVNLLNASGAVIADAQAVGTIINDDVPPAIAIGDVARVEGNAGTTTFAFDVTLSSASAQPVTVNFATANGTATSGSDYQAASGTVTFAPGETSKTINIAVVGDTLIEPNETFFVNLSNANGATIADGQAVGTILNDDVAPALSISDVTKAEGQKGKNSFTFTVSLSAPATQTVTVNYATFSGTALAGSDFSGKNGTLTFKPGQTSKTITIQVNTDRIREADEFFYIDLFGNSSNSTIKKNRGIGTILNDD